MGSTEIGANGAARPSCGGRGDAWALAAVVTVVAAIYMPMLATGNRLARNDDFLQHAARHEFVRKSVFKHGMFPLRSHYVGSGFPTLGDPEDPSLNPLVWLLLALPTPVLLKARFFIAPVLGAFGTFLLARRALGYTTWGAAFSALVFSLGFWLPDKVTGGNLNEVYPAFVPLCLFLILTAPRRPLRFALLPVLMFTMLSDGKQALFAAILFMGIVCAAWAALGGRASGRRARWERFHPLVYLFLGVLFTFLIGLCRILPTLEVMSHRGGLLNLDLYSHPRNLSAPFPTLGAMAQAILDLRDMPFFLRALRVGLVPTALFLGAMVLAVRRAAVWGIAAALFLWLMAGPNAPVNLHAALTSLPLYDTLDRPWKYLTPFVTLAVSLGAGAFFGPLMSVRPRWLRQAMAAAATGAAVFALTPLAAHVSARPFTMLAPVPPVRVPGGFYSVAGDGLRRIRAFPRQAGTYFNLVRSVGTIDWYTALPLPENGRPRFRVKRDGREVANGDWRGEAYFQKQGKRCAASFDPNRIRVAVEVTEPDVLIINQNFHAGWRTDRGELEEREGLLAVKLDRPGSYRVTLRYVSRPFRLGLAFSLGGVLLLAAFVAARCRGRLAFLAALPPRTSLSESAKRPHRTAAWPVTALVGAAVLLSLTRFGLVRQKDFLRQVRSRAHLAAGLEHFDCGRYDRAIEDFTKAIELDPMQIKPYMLRGEAHGLRGRDDRAIEDFTRAVRLRPDSHWAHNSRGLAYSHMGRQHRAIQDLTRAITLKPDWGEPYHHRAVAYYYVHLNDKARADVKMCRKLGYPVAADLLKELSEKPGQTR